jgi:hypothetical protein
MFDAPAQRLGQQHSYMAFELSAAEEEVASGETVSGVEDRKSE